MNAIHEQHGPFFPTPRKGKISLPAKNITLGGEGDKPSFLRGSTGKCGEKASPIRMANP